MHYFNLFDCVEQFNKGEIDANTMFKMQRQILFGEIEDKEFRGFAIENFSEVMGYIVQWNLNIRIHRYITGVMGFRYNQNFEGDINNGEGYGFRMICIV